MFRLALDGLQIGLKGIAVDEPNAHLLVGPQLAASNHPANVLNAVAEDVGSFLGGDVVGQGGGSWGEYSAEGGDGKSRDVLKCLGPDLNLDGRFGVVGESLLCVRKSLDVGCNHPRHDHLHHPEDILHGFLSILK